MKLAIISDTHDNLAILEKAVKWMKESGVEEIIHCGDVCFPDTLQWLAKNFPGKTHLVFGNADDNQTTMEKIAVENSNIVLYNESGEIKIDNTNISFCHYPNLARKLAQTGKYDLIFYGHTHQPWEETMKISFPDGQEIFPKKENNCRLINPGNLSNMLYKASFAVYNSETEKLELKIMENL